ncbi:hypothetical protein [Streptomyces sp. NPDC001292]|uniref:hypothetical protein n=1 Tax=Streptomyces sp. NPDC001292 TaxID=3364558 RepID=UPI0036822639
MRRRVLGPIPGFLSLFSPSVAKPDGVGVRATAGLGGTTRTGQQTIEEYAQTWLPRQRKITEYSTAKTLASHFRAQINPVIGSRKLNSVTPTVVEDFLDHLEAEGVGRGHQLNVYRALSALLRDAFEKGAIADDPLRGVQKPEYSQTSRTPPAPARALALTSTSVHSRPLTWVGVSGFVGVIVTGATTSSATGAPVSCTGTPFVRMGGDSGPAVSQVLR